MIIQLQQILSQEDKLSGNMTCNLNIDHFINFWFKFLKHRPYGYHQITQYNGKLPSTKEYSNQHRRSIKQMMPEYCREQH